MSLASDIARLGVQTLATVRGERTGTLTQAGTAYAVTGALVISYVRGTDADADSITIVLHVPSSGITPAPLRDSRFVFTGESATYTVEKCEPIAALASALAEGWRLTLKTWINRLSSP